jgi:hypothetical protein
MAEQRWTRWLSAFYFDFILHLTVRMSSTASSTNFAPSQLEAGPEKKDNSMIVDWDGPEDRENPRNWSPRKRWGHVVIISILALITYVSCLLPSLIEATVWSAAVPFCLTPFIY